MFNVPVFLILSAIAVVATIIVTPRLIEPTYSNIPGNPRRILLASSITNNLLLSISAAAVGSYMAPRIGLSSPFFESLTQMDEPHIKLLHVFFPASFNSIYALLGILLIQVVLVNRALSLPDYIQPSISVRILKEGVLEEIIYRWGLMSLIARILFIEFSLDKNSSILIAIIISALGSAASHISDLTRYNFRRIDLAILSVILVNFWGAIVYGSLLCQYGLATAIACHSIVIFVSSVSHDVMRFFATSDSSY